MWKLLNAFSLEWSHQFSWHLFHFLTPHLQAKLWVGSVSLLFLYLIDYCYLLIIINFNQISTILFLMITIINWTKYCRHKHTIEISWTSVCTYPVIEYHCVNVPSCMASHSPFFVVLAISIWYQVRIVSIFDNVHKLNHIIFLVKVLSAWTKKIIASTRVLVISISSSIWSSILYLSSWLLFQGLPLIRVSSFFPYSSYQQR